ncbi:MAG: FtsK/SpoIIIE domain-containing protein [Dysosmobacter sp.]
MKSFTSPEFIIAMVALALVFTAIVCLVQMIRTPPLLKRRFDRAVRRCGLRNAQGEYPVLVSVKRDREKAHGLILKVRNKGVAVPDFDRQYDRLKTSLNGIIYCMEYSRNTNFTLLFFLPQKYVRPVLLTPDDEAVGRMDITHFINMLVIGATGTGKTVAIKILMAKILKFIPNAKLWLLDFKKFDFRDFAGLPRYYGFSDCVQGLRDFYTAFKRQQELGIAGEPHYLVIDEWGSFIASLDKKEAEEMKRLLSELLMLGRAYQFFPIVGIQRPDASASRLRGITFNAVLRWAIQARRVGGWSFRDSTAGRIMECKKREGHLYIDGMGLEKVRIADIADIDALDAIIREAMSR